MLISKIRLSNFKNFEDIEVDLGKMNVFVGANASGKSNFLQALKFIRDIKDFGIENAISLQGGIEYLRNVNLKERNKVSISIDFQIGSGGKIIKVISQNSLLVINYDKVVYSLEINIQKGKRYNINKEHIRFYTKIQEIIFENGLSHGNELERKTFGSQEVDIISYKGKINLKSNFINFENEIKNGKTKLKLINNTIEELDVSLINDTIFPTQLLADNSNELSNKKTFLELFYRVLLIDFLDFPIYDFDLKSSKKPTSIVGKADLEENGENLSIALKHILEDKEKARQFSNLLSDILPFIKGIEVEKQYDKSLSFKVKEGYNANVVIPSSLLSDGTISITAILTALFFQENRLAIFEEPEHGVHPALIAKLMQFFYEASEKKQIIITTHSPEILKQTKLEDLRLVTREEDGFGKIIKPAEQEMVKAFLENELGIEQLFTQNLLDR